MADNRLYLYCPECNKHLFLGKHFGGGYNITDWCTIEMIEQFINEHGNGLGCKVQLREETKDDIFAITDTDELPADSVAEDTVRKLIDADILIRAIKNHTFDWKTLHNLRDNEHICEFIHYILSQVIADIKNQPVVQNNSKENSSNE